MPIKERRTCAECGFVFLAKASDIKRGGGKYCSRACWRRNARLTDAQYETNAAAMRVSRSGPGNPQFKHGRRAGFTIRGWSIRDKDEEFCRACGAPASDLHHAVPRSLAPSGRRDLRNGLPLCRSCHTSWHRRGVTLHRDLFTVEEWRFIETLIGPVWLDERYPDRGEGFRKVVAA